MMKVSPQFCSLLCLYQVKGHSEEIARMLIENNALFDEEFFKPSRIFYTNKRLSYNANHSGLIDFKNQGQHRAPDPNREDYGKGIRGFREEEHVSIDLYTRYRHQEHDQLGYVIDYQIPVYRTNYKSEFCGCNLKNIDLMTQKEDNIYLIELKPKRHRSTPSDSLLRCILEIESYYFSIDQHQLIMDYSDQAKSNRLYRFKAFQVKRAIMIYENTRAHRELLSIKEKKNTYPFVSEFLKFHQDVEVFVMIQEERYEKYTFKDHFSIKDLFI